MERLHPGQVVGAGQPVFTLAHDGASEVEIHVPESQVAQYAPDRPAVVELWADTGHRAEARIREVAPGADATTRTYRVRVAFIDETFTPRLGQTARVHFGDGSGASHWRVPLSALHEKDGKPALWKVVPASRQVQLGDVTLHRPALDIERAHNGQLSLMALLPDPPATSKGDPSPVTPWQWQLGRLALDDGSVDFTDLAAGTRPVTTQITAMKGHLDGLSHKLGEARPFALAGTIDRGSFDASGTLRPDPLGAEMKLATRNLDIAPFEPYLDVPLNVTIASARLTSDGQLNYDARGHTPSLRYRGNAALERVRVQDKLTDDDFLRWRTLTASRLDAELGPDAPQVDVGALVLTSFYARMIINADGRLNLSDVVASPASAPTDWTTGACASGARSPSSPPASSADGSSTTWGRAPSSAASWWVLP